MKGGGWQYGGSLNGSIMRGNGYDQTWSIRVRATDSEGQQAVSPTYSAKTNSPPQPSVRTVKGASGYWPGECTHSSCAKMKIVYSNLPDATYSLRCNATGINGGTWGGPYSVRLSGNGEYQLNCFFGDPGETGWVSMGSRNADSMTWY